MCIRDSLNSGNDFVRSPDLDAQFLHCRILLKTSNQGDGASAMAANGQETRSATKSNDLDCEVDESPCTAYKWFGLGDGYQCDAVFHIAFS